jgi:hypothetical protein
MRSILLFLQLILFVGTAVLLHDAGNPESTSGRPPVSDSRTSAPAATVAAPTPHLAADTPAHSKRVPRSAL